MEAISNTLLQISDLNKIADYNFTQYTLSWQLLSAVLNVENCYAEYEIILKSFMGKVGNSGDHLSLIIIAKIISAVCAQYLSQFCPLFSYKIRKWNTLRIYELKNPLFINNYIHTICFVLPKTTTVFSTRQSNV